MCNLINTYIHTYAHAHKQVSLTPTWRTNTSGIERLGRQDPIARLCAHTRTHTQRYTDMTFWFREAPRKGERDYDRCRMDGTSREGTMEDSLWRETAGRSLGSCDAAGTVCEVCHVSGCRKVTAQPHATSFKKTRCSSPTHFRVLHRVLARSLLELQIGICYLRHTAFPRREPEDTAGWTQISSE